MDAGSVRISVDIDASNLSSKLSNEIHRAIAPALARAQTEINKIGGSRGGGDPFRQINGDIDRHVKKLGEYHGVLGQMNLMWDQFLAKTVLVGSAISTLTPLIGLLGGAIGVLGGGIGVVIGGVGQLTAGMSALVPAIGGAVAALKIGFQGLKDGAKAYMKQFDDANAVIAAQIGNMMGPMLTAWQQVSSQIKLDFAQAMVPAFNNLGALIRELGPSLSAVGQAFAGVATTVTATLNGLAPQLNTILAGSKTLFDGIKPGVQTLTEGLVTMGAQAQKAMPAIAGAISNAMGQVGTAMAQAAQTPAFQSALQGFAQIIQQVGGLLAGLGSTMIQIGGQVGPIFAQLIGAIGPALNDVLLAFGNIATTAGPVFNQFISALGPALASVVNGLGRMGEIVGPTLIPLLNALAAALGPLYEPLAQLGAKLAESLTALIPTAGELIKSVIAPMVDLLPTFGSVLKTLGDVLIAAGPAIHGVASAIGSIAQGLVAGLQPLIPVINQIAQMLQPVLVQLGAAAGQLLAQLLQIIAANWQEVMPQLVQAFNDLWPAVQQLLDAIIPLLPQIIELATQSAVLALKLGSDLLPVVAAFTPAIGTFADGISKLGPIIDTLLQGVGAVADGIGAAISGVVDTATSAVNQLINLYNTAVKPILSAMHIVMPWTPEPPDISPITTGGTWTGTGFQNVEHPGNQAPGMPKGVPGFNTGKNGASSLPQIPGLPGAYPNAPAGPYTPVAPDIKGAQGAATSATKQPKPLSVEDLPLDVLANTPEEIGLLSEIRDLLAGTGNADAPLNKLKDLNPALQRISEDLKKMLPEAKLPPGSIPGRMGPFGTPIPARNPEWEGWNAFLKVWGVPNPEYIIGQNPIEYATDQWKDQVDQWKQLTQDQIQTWQDTEKQQQQWAQQFASATGTASTGTGYNWAALAQAESSGNWAANTGNGFFGGLQFDQATWDSYKPAGAPSRADQATMQQQIQAAQNAINARGGPQTLWPKNWQQLGTAVSPSTLGALTQAATAPSLSGQFNMSSNLAAALQVAKSGTAYEWGGVGQGGLYDCSGFMSDIYAALTGKPYTGNERYFTTASDFAALGFQPGFDPRSVFNIGVNAHHMAGTLAGIPVEAGGPSGGGPVFGAGQGAQQKQFTSQWHLPQGFEAAGMPIGATSLGGGATVPVYVTNWPGQAPAGGPVGSRMTPEQAAAAKFGTDFAQNVTGAAITATGDVTTDIASRIISAIPQALIAMQGPRAPSATPEQLIGEGNPMLALAAASGLSVEDFTRMGGAGPASITQPTGPGYDASGRLFSDTASLLDRSFSSLSAQIDAMRKQTTDLLNQVLARLADDVLIPLIKAAVQAAIGTLSQATTTAIGTALGDAAAPPIADAVGESVANSAPAQGGGILGGLFNIFDEGGPLESGMGAVNLSGSTEQVLNPTETRLFNSGLLGGWNLGQFSTRQWADTSALFTDWLGMSSQGPLADLLNMIASVFLSVIGVTITVRETLLRLEDDFRAFRGDAFKVFAAQGQLMEDTSALIDRSLSTAAMVAQEKSRILGEVIAGTLKFILDQIVIPIGQAVASAAVSALAQAAGTAVEAGIGLAGGGMGSQAAGSIAGSFVSSLISGVGNAMINITAKIIEQLGNAIIDVGTKYVFDYLAKNYGGYAPPRQPTPATLNLQGKPLSSVFGRRGVNIFGFDDGGMAYGTGLMPKTTIPPERVLSARETVAFERLVESLTEGKIGTSRNVTINSPINVMNAGPDTSERIHDGLLALLS